MGLALNEQLVTKTFKYYHSGYLVTIKVDDMGKYLKSLLIIFVLAFAAFSSVLGTKVLSEERITTNTDKQEPRPYTATSSSGKTIGTATGTSTATT